MGSLLPLGTWVRNPSLRSWPVLLFMLLFTVPPVAIVVFYNNPGQSTFTEAAWILAAYFALAWLLLIAVVVRPATISLLLLLAVIAISAVTEVPLAIWLETMLHSGTSNIVTSIFTVGLPEEFAKAIPIIVIAVTVRRRITPADYLFLGAVSGLAFGASEAEHYLTSGVGLVGGNATQDIAAARGAPDVAAELAELAAALTPLDQLCAQWRRRANSGEYLLQAGDTARARHQPLQETGGRAVVAADSRLPGSGTRGLGRR